jgi:hypothetical protein
MLTYLRGIAVAIAVTLAAATFPGAARAQFSGLCDQVTVEYFSKFWHIKPPILRPLNEEMNARQIACGNVYRLSPEFDLVVSYGGMVFLNSFNAQSFSLGVNFEVQYRPDVLGNFGLYGGLDAGFIYGYQGFLRPDLLIGPLRAGAIAKAGFLYDVPDTNLTAFAGVRYVPARGRNGSGIFAPGIGLTYHFD